jgi:hypothetical protein
LTPPSSPARSATADSQLRTAAEPEAAEPEAAAAPQAAATIVGTTSTSDAGPFSAVQPNAVLERFRPVQCGLKRRKHS